MVAAIKIIAATSTAMSDLSSLQSKSDALSRSLDFWNNVYVWGLIVAFVTGAITLVATKRAMSSGRQLSSVNSDIARIKEHQFQTALEGQRKATEEQRQRAADSETKLEEIRRKQQPRALDIAKFKAALEGKPRCDIEIFCQPNDNEAWVLAFNISGALGTSGWTATQPIPIPDDMIPQVKKMFGKPDMPIEEQQMFENIFKSYPPVLRAGTGLVGDFGIFVVSNQDVIDEFRQKKLESNTPQGALVNAFNSVGLNASPGLPNNELPDNKLRIVVAAKPQE